MRSVDSRIENAVMLSSYCTALFVITLVVVAGRVEGAEPKPLPGTPTKWHGFAKHDFKVGYLEVTVIVSAKPLPGGPWVLRGEFFDAFVDAGIALVKEGGTWRT